jgi:hypothetical protein
MFQITQDPSSGSDNLYLIEITYNGSVVLIMCIVNRQAQHIHTPQVENMLPNTDHTHTRGIEKVKNVLPLKNIY